MTISIHHKLKPFSHEKGQHFLVPTSRAVFQIYPCLIKAFDLETKKSLCELKLSIENFSFEFTTEVDFEKRHIRVFGKSEKGFVELKIRKNETGFELVLERFFEASLSLHHNGKLVNLGLKETLFLFEEKSEELTHETLFLGATKKQDLSRIMKDKDAKEMLPYLFTLGLNLKLPHLNTSCDVLNLVEALDEANQLEKTKLLETLLGSFVKEGFIPSLSDDLHQGLGLKETAINPLYLIQKLSMWFKSCLAFQQGHKLVMFSKMPKAFIAGRAKSLKFDFGCIHLEWTKGFLRQVIVDVKKEIRLEIVFPKTVKSFRVKHQKKTISLPEILKPGIYHFDRFEA